MRCAAAVILALVAHVSLISGAHAEDRIAPPDYRRDGAVVVVGGALYLLGEVVAKDALSPDTCRWCDDNRLDRGVRDALVWDHRATANTLSNVSAFVAAPVLGVGLLQLTGTTDHLVHNTLILAEAGVVASDLAYLIKLAAARERPFVHQLPDADKRFTDKPAENNLSFFSGHATLAMTLAVAAGTTATLRGYRHHRLVWATTVPVALATGYLRIAADRHYTTDVVVGWTFGAAVGFAVPYFLHRRRAPGAPTPVVARTATSTTVGVALTW